MDGEAGSKASGDEGEIRSKYTIGGTKTDGRLLWDQSLPGAQTFNHGWTCIGVRAPRSFPFPISLGPCAGSTGPRLMRAVSLELDGDFHSLPQLLWALSPEIGPRLGPGWAVSLLCWARGFAQATSGGAGAPGRPGGAAAAHPPKREPDGGILLGHHGFFWQWQFRPKGRVCSRERGGNPDAEGTGQQLRRGPIARWRVNDGVMVKHPECGGSVAWQRAVAGGVAFARRILPAWLRC